MQLIGLSSIIIFAVLPFHAAANISVNFKVQAAVITTATKQSSTTAKK